MARGLLRMALRLRLYNCSAELSTEYLLYRTRSTIVISESARRPKSRPLSRARHSEVIGGTDPGTGTDYWWSRGGLLRGESPPLIERFAAYASDTWHPPFGQLTPSYALPVNAVLTRASEVLSATSDHATVAEPTSSISTVWSVPQGMLATLKRGEFVLYYATLPGSYTGLAIPDLPADAPFCARLVSRTSLERTVCHQPFEARCCGRCARLTVRRSLCLAIVPRAHARDSHKEHYEDNNDEIG